MPGIKRSLPVTFISVLLISFAEFSACKNISRKDSHPEISSLDIEAGKSLAAVYCQSCHLLPNPSLLDSKTWKNGVLPQMGPRLGIFSFNGKTYPSAKSDMNLDKGFYPAQPVLAASQWQQILDYYTAVAPDTLPSDNHSHPSIVNHLADFTVVVPTFKALTPATTFVKINNNNLGQSIISGDAIKKTLYKFDNKLKIADSVHTAGPILDLEAQANGWLACNVGVLNPNNGKYGTAININVTATGKLKPADSLLFQGLMRPVQITSADLNSDGKKDYLVCEFGFETGALSWMENLGNGKFNRHVIRPLPGALKAYIDDYNHDGLPDIWALFAQGEEGIFLFTNKGRGNFEQKQVLRFPPVYGSSYFEFADFNKDGHPDIIYTCGDNADYSIILKPYHGVYIFMNDGHNSFSQKYFFHINGGYKAMARDFDNDGDLDIATISFFADYQHHPEEGFVYLENKGNFTFSAYASPETQQGRWLTMDAGDINNDGKTDIVLGNFSIGPAKEKSKYDWKKGPPFIVLENIGKRHL